MPLASSQWTISGSVVSRQTAASFSASMQTININAPWYKQWGRFEGTARLRRYTN